jgi:pimeloyl-ACP methyl ester carboxylesterase
MQVVVGEQLLNFSFFGQGQPLLLLHGWGDDSRSWYPVAEQLSKQYQVFLLDLPGFGASEPPKTPWGLEDYRDLVVRFVHELELDQLILVGHSHGGKIAAAVAAIEGRCAGLVLIAASGVNARKFKAMLKVYSFKAAKHLLQPLGLPGRQWLEHLRMKFGSTDYQQAGEMRATLVRLVNQKVVRSLSAIKIPTLIVWGSEDKVLEVTLAKRFRNLISNSYIRLVWGAGHFPHVDAPEELAEIILNFEAAR